MTNKSKSLFLFFILIISLPSYAVSERNVTICDTSTSVQTCIDNSISRTVKLTEGVHNTNGVLIPSNFTLIIPKGSILRLDDGATLNDEAFGGDANYVVASIGTSENLVENVHLIINGEIDGNKRIHTYERGGVEGIDWKWVKNSSISGTGVIHSANGDGIDLDAVYNTRVEGVTVKDNGDSGIHFGSPRPIVGSLNNIVIGVTSINNGFRIGKSGFDLSWPNPDGVVYINCTAIDNYRNFDMEASGGAIYNSKSINNGNVVEADSLSGADYAYLNGQNLTNKSLISTKTKILLKRDIKKMLGMSYHKHLDGIEY